MKFSLGLDKGRYRITFTLEGKTKRFYPGTKDGVAANQVLRRMSYEWEAGQFDLSLQSYKLKNRGQANAPGPTKKKGSSKVPKLLTLWDRWVESLNLPDSTKNNHYHCCRVMIVKANNPDWDDVSWYLQSELSGSTWNIRRRFIKSCTTWAQTEGLVDGKNPWIKLKARKHQKTGANPLTVEETQLVIQAFEQDQFCSKCAPCKHSFYTLFLKFLLLTAVRPGEAIALQWKHVDFKLGFIEISEAMGRDLASSPYTTKKVRKDTKTGELRYLPLTPILKELLMAHRPNDAKANDLVFPGARGKVLDTKAFRRVWKKVLLGLELEYRNPYQTRHTSLSQIAQHHGLLAAARVAGHKSLDMVSRHYAKFTGDLSEIMPNFEQKPSKFD